MAWTNTFAGPHTDGLERHLPPHYGLGTPDEVFDAEAAAEAAWCEEQQAQRRWQADKLDAEIAAAERRAGKRSIV